MKFLLGSICGTLITLAGLYGFVTYTFSDYMVREQILTSPDVQNSVVAIKSFQENLRKYSEVRSTRLCDFICDKSPYWDQYGKSPSNKIKSLNAELQARGAKAVQDPGFLLDAFYVEKAMMPIEGSGFFNWLKTLPSECSQQWQERVHLASDLAMVAPQVLMALQEVQRYLKLIAEIKELRQSCQAKNHSEVQARCQAFLAQ